MEPEGYNNHSAQDGHPEKDCAYCGAENAADAVGVDPDRKLEHEEASGLYVPSGRSWPT